MPFNTERDYRKYLSRLDTFPSQIKDKIYLMRKAIQEKTTIHAVSLTGAQTSLEKFIVSNITFSPLFKPFLEYPAKFPDELRTKLNDEATRVIQQMINPSIIDLLQFINNEYLPSTRANVSVSTLPDGPTYYKACLKWHTSVEWTPETIHNKGLEEVDRIEKLMEKIKVDHGFNGTLLQFISHLQSKKDNFFETEAEMIEGYTSLVHETHKKLPRVLLKVPKAKIVVKKSTNPQSRSGRYNMPSLDGSRPGEFVANVGQPKQSPKFNMPSLALHEAEPGHHTQFTYAMEEELPEFRRLIEYRNYNAVPFNWPFHTAYVEGWALYAESLGDDLEVYNSSLEKFGRYDAELFRACRLVVDTGIHALGWSRENAIEYLKNHTSRSNDFISDEVNRYISWPGQACAYKIGELKIQELRRKAEEAAGEAFDLRRFHNEILKLGPMPLYMLEERINEWIFSDSIKVQISFQKVTLMSLVSVLFIAFV
jgi:uncharacterized protein (DUF885 family)